MSIDEEICFLFVLHTHVLIQREILQLDFQASSYRKTLDFIENVSA